MKVDNKESFARYYQNPTEKAKNDLIKQNAPMVTEIINRKFSFSNHKDDLRQEGLIALWNCIDKYEVDKGEFSTYAYLAVKNRMLNWISRFQHVVRVPKLSPVDICGEEVLNHQAFHDADHSSVIDAVKNLTPKEQTIFMNFLDKKGEVTKNEYKIAAKVKRILKKN